MGKGDGPRPSRRAYQINWTLMSREEVRLLWTAEACVKTFFVDPRGAILSVENETFQPVRGQKIRNRAELLKLSRIRVYPRPPQLRGRKK